MPTLFLSVAARGPALASSLSKRKMADRGWWWTVVRLTAAFAVARLCQWEPGLLGANWWWIKAMTSTLAAATSKITFMPSSSRRRCGICLGCPTLRVGKLQRSLGTRAGWMGPPLLQSFEWCLWVGHGPCSSRRLLTPTLWVRLCRGFPMVALTKAKSALMARSLLLHRRRLCEMKFEGGF